MYSWISLMVLVIILISIVTAANRRSRPPLGPGGYPPPQLGQPYPPQLGSGYYGAGPYGQPDPYGQPGYGQPALYGQTGYGAPYSPAQLPMSPAAGQAVDADITTYGDELRDLDLDVVGRQLDDAAQRDYSTALDAYDRAKDQLSRASTEADVRSITQTLEQGRYAIACVKARANGQPVPEHRPPCFFDPAHGTSVDNVQWAPPGGAVREVPACEADLRRVRTGMDPSIRMVPMGGGHQVPYWEDQQHAAWAQGYYDRYSGDPTLRAITRGALMIGAFSLLRGVFDD